MPQIVVTTAGGPEGRRGTIDTELLRERVLSTDLESDRFRGHLVERIAWALQDADEVERGAGVTQAREGLQEGGETPRTPEVA